MIFLTKLMSVARPREMNQKLISWMVRCRLLEPISWKKSLEK